MNNVQKSLAQGTFQKTFGTTLPDRGYCIQKTFDNGYVIGGVANDGWGTSSSDVCLLKIDSAGELVWHKIFGDIFKDEAYVVRQTADSGFVLVGYTQNYGVYGDAVYLIKTDVNGNILWSKTYATNIIHMVGMEDIGWDVRQTSDSGFVIVGQTYDDSTDYPSILLLKTNSTGEMLWNKVYRSLNSNPCMGRCVLQTIDNGFFIAGYIDSMAGIGYDMCLIKTNEIGDTIWTKILGTYYDDVPYCIQQTSDSCIIITGSMRPTILNYTGSVMALLKINLLGDTLWSKIYKTPGSLGNYSQSVEQTSDGGYILTGGGPFAGYSGIIKTNAVGDTLWTNFITDYASIQSITQTRDNGYMLSGVNQYGIGNGDVFIAKTDSIGRSSCYNDNMGYLVYSGFINIYPQQLVIGSKDLIIQNVITPVTNDGAETTICRVEINDISNDPSFIVFPNPFDKEFTILGDELGEAILFDVMGKEVLRQKCFGVETKINTENFSSGFYLLRCTGAKTPLSIKIVKQ